MNKYLRIYAVVEKEDGDIVYGDPETMDGHIFTRNELTIRLDEDGSLPEPMVEIHEYFDKFLSSIMEGMEKINE